MKSILKTFIPSPTRLKLRMLAKKVRYEYRRWKIKLPVSQKKGMKIIVGAAETYQDGWYSTNENWLDITNSTHWKKVFHGEQLLTHVVAEHVFEHLSYDEALNAIKLINQHMRPGGVLRIAVPDGLNPNPLYLKHVGINGIGDDAADHKQLLTAPVLSKLLEDGGFVAELKEGYQESGTLVQLAYDKAQGYIKRSRANSENLPATWNFPDAGTSLIVDGLKRG